MRRFGLLFTLILMSILQPGSAQETNIFFSVQLENDLWGSNDDRYYTHGTKLSWASNKPAPGFLKRLVERLPFYSVGETEIHGYEFGQAIFTPEDIEQSSLIENDRPYAGWLYFNTGIGNFYYDRGDRDRLNMLLLTIGIVGPSALAEDTQEVVHSVFGATNPEGWDNQLEDELGLNATFVDKWRRIYDFDEPRQRELGLHYNLALGNVYTYAAAGFQLRYGTHLKTDIGPPSILPGFPGASAFNPNLQSNWYFFGGIEFRLMRKTYFSMAITSATAIVSTKSPLSPIYNSALPIISASDFYRLVALCLR